MKTIYQRRVEQEWISLESLAELNRHLQIRGHGCRTGDHIFELSLAKTGATIVSNGQVSLLHNHAITIRFPQFFPSVPLELFLAEPVFHPNVHPENGFVCLWDRFSPRDSVPVAIWKLQKMLAWELLNRETDHVMQPKSLEWQDDLERGIALPLDYEPVRIPAGMKPYCVPDPIPGTFRKRLS